MLSIAQRARFFGDWWPQICRLRGVHPDDREARLEFFAECGIGRKSVTEMNTKSDFDAIIAHVMSILKPAAVKPQLRQLREPQTRQRYVLRELLQCLALYVTDADAYAREIIRDTVNRGSVQAVTRIEDLDGHQLGKLIMDLSRRLNSRHGLRNQAGDTLHSMKVRAGVKCTCSACAAESPREASVPAGGVFAGIEQALEDENVPF